MVDFIVAVDGAYIGIGERVNYSSDGTIETVRQLVGKKGIVIQPNRQLSEPQKRNEYLRYIEEHMPGSWVFVIDADEILRDAEEDFEWLRTIGALSYQIGYILRNDRKPDMQYGFHLYTAIHQRTPFHPKLYHGIPGLHYAENHWALRDADRERVEPKYAGVRLAHTWLEHRRIARARREVKLRNYYNIYGRWKYEKVGRPLKSYLPYQLLASTETLLDRIGFKPQRYLEYVYWYTLGSFTRES
jgi:hypothetical protein